MPYAARDPLRSAGVGRFDPFSDGKERTSGVPGRRDLTRWARSQ